MTAADTVDRNGHNGVAEPLLTAEQVSEQILNVPASWVLAEARAGRIPHHRLGRYVRFHASELHTWLEDRARGPRAT
jgi:excisionase family DNA binding protein